MLVIIKGNVLIAGDCFPSVHSVGRDLSEVSAPHRQADGRAT